MPNIPVQVAQNAIVVKKLIKIRACLLSGIVVLDVSSGTAVGDFLTLAWSLAS